MSRLDLTQNRYSELAALKFDDNNTLNATITAKEGAGKKGCRILLFQNRQRGVPPCLHTEYRISSRRALERLTKLLLGSHHSALSETESDRKKKGVVFPGGHS